MKKEIAEILKESLSFMLCVTFLFAIAYYTGFLKNFSIQNFINAYNDILNISKVSNKDYATNTKTRIVKYGNYQPSRIPEAVLRGVESSNTWGNVFNSNTKAIFYIYDESSKDFHYRIQNYTPKLNANYNVFAYTTENFNNIRTGVVGPSKICNSLEECNEQRIKASDYSALAGFMRSCGKTLCIINPSKGQYVRLMSKDGGQAVQMISALKHW